MVFGAAEPYSKTRHGDLLAYLNSHDGGLADNMFLGSDSFFEIKGAGLLLARQTYIRLSRSPAPDYLYFVNDDFMLESKGSEDDNMSCIPAPKGIYDPIKVLRRKLWSIHGLLI